MKCYRLFPHWFFALYKCICIVFYCIALHCIALHCIVLYCIVLYCIVLYCIVLYCIVLYCIVLYCIVLYCIVLYCIVLETVFISSSDEKKNFKATCTHIQLFDLFRRTHLFWSISILSPALNKVSVKYAFGHFSKHLLDEATYSDGFVSIWRVLKIGFETDKQCRFGKSI